MADPGCRTCFDTGVIFDNNDLALPCPVCDAWMEPETSVTDRQKRKKTPKKSPKIDIDLNDANPDSWSTSWWDDDDFDWGADHFWEDDDTPLRPVQKGKGKKKNKQPQVKWWDDPTDPFGPKGDEKSESGRNPRPIQNRERGRNFYYQKPKNLPATDYVRDVPEREKPEGDWFEYDTRWFNDDLNNHVLHTVRTLTDAYPVTKKWFRGIRVSDVPPTACVVPNDRKIWLTPSFLDKPGTNGFKRKNEGLDRLIAHEFGHVLHASILADSVGEEALPDLDMNDLLGRNYKSDSLSHPDSPATYIMEEGKQKVQDPYITGYGETDELERFAEAMTEHWTRANPPELAGYVGKHIDFLYHKDGRLNKSLDDQSWWESTMDKKDTENNYKGFWSDVTGQDYKGWWQDTKRKQQTEKAEKAEYQRWWDKNAHIHHPNENIMEFISDPKEPRDWETRQYRKWWNREIGQQYENWWQIATGEEPQPKEASAHPEVLYHIAPMSRRHEFLNNGIEPTIAFSNETDAKQAAKKRAATEPQDIWYIDPTGLDIARAERGWRVRSNIGLDNIMQVEGFDERRASHEDEHERDLEFAGNINEVNYYIASCKCGWKSNIRSERAAKNAWQRHSDSLNEILRRQLAGPAPDTFSVESRNWKSVIDSSTSDEIGYEHGQQASASHAQAARPRQEAPRRSARTRTGAEVQGDPEGASEGLGFSDEDRAFLDDPDNWPCLHDIATIHDAVADGIGIEDPDAVESAIGAVQNAYAYGQHRDIFHTAADLIDKIAARQAMLNGNKRTATFSALQFLENAGYDSVAAEEHLVDCPECLGGTDKHEDRCYFCDDEKFVPPLARLVNGLADGAKTPTTQRELEDFLRNHSAKMRKQASYTEHDIRSREPESFRRQNPEPWSDIAQPSMADGKPLIIRALPGGGKHPGGAGGGYPGQSWSVRPTSQSPDDLMTQDALGQVTGKASVTAHSLGRSAVANWRSIAERWRHTEDDGFEMWETTEDPNQFAIIENGDEYDLYALEGSFDSPEEAKASVRTAQDGGGGGGGASGGGGGGASGGGASGGGASGGGSGGASAGGGGDGGAASGDGGATSGDGSATDGGTTDGTTDGGGQPSSGDDEAPQPPSEPKPSFGPSTNTSGDMKCPRCQENCYSIGANYYNCMFCGWAGYGYPRRKRRKHIEASPTWQPHKIVPPPFRSGNHSIIPGGALQRLFDELPVHAWEDGEPVGHGNPQLIDYKIDNGALERISLDDNYRMYEAPRQKPDVSINPLMQAAHGGKRIKPYVQVNIQGADELKGYQNKAIKGWLQDLLDNGYDEDKTRAFVHEIAKGHDIVSNICGLDLSFTNADGTTERHRAIAPHSEEDNRFKYWSDAHWHRFNDSLNPLPHSEWHTPATGVDKCWKPCKGVPDGRAEHDLDAREYHENYYCGDCEDFEEVFE